MLTFGVPYFKKTISGLYNLFRVLIFQLQLKRFLSNTPNSSREYIYIWIPPRLNENLGDLGMFTALDEFYKNEKIVYISDNPSIHGLKTTQTKLFFDHKSSKKFLFDSLTHYQAKRLIIVGADTLDGAYSLAESLFKLLMAWNFQRSSVRADLVNLSWNDRKLSKLLKYALRLANDIGVGFYVRDSISLSRLKTYEVRTRLCADLVFSLTPKIDYPVQDVFEIWRSVNDSIVAIGFGVPYDNKGNYLEEMVQICQNLLDRSFSILLAPSSFSKGDKELCLKLVATIDSEKLFLYENWSSNYEFFEVLSKANFGISNRMHFVIHALRVHVPTIGVKYQGKFEGLYNHLDMQDFNVDKISDVSGVLDLFIQELQTNKRRISGNLTQLIGLSKNNFG